MDVCGYGRQNVRSEPILDQLRPIHHMSIRVAKEFRFEAAHRLPWHEGLCSNLHGHSYHVVVALTGERDERGMVVDFKHLKRMVVPLIKRWDHAVLAAESDQELIESVRALGSRLEVLPCDTTAENMADYIAREILDEHRSFLAERGISRVTVSVRETVSSEATIELEIG